jgi:hypothetical protein
VSNTYQKKSRRAQPDLMPAEAAVPEQVIVSMAGIAGAAKEGLLALAVGTGLQVMAAMFDEDVTGLCGPDGRHDPGRAGYRHGAGAGSVTLGGRRLPVPGRGCGPRTGPGSCTCPVMTCSPPPSSSGGSRWRRCWPGCRRAGTCAAWSQPGRPSGTRLRR